MRHLGSGNRVVMTTGKYKGTQSPLCLLAGLQAASGPHLGVVSLDDLL